MTDDPLREAFEAALTAASIEIPCESPAEAIALRHRLNRFRARHRRTMAEVYGEANSPYDGLVVSIEGPAVIIRRLAKLRIIKRGRAEPAEAEPTAPSLCEWCGTPCEGRFCCVEHEEAVMAQVVDTS